jgi:hypothetical protein
MPVRIVIVAGDVNVFCPEAEQEGIVLPDVLVTILLNYLMAMPGFEEASPASWVLKVGNCRRSALIDVMEAL